MRILFVSKEAYILKYLDTFDEFEIKFCDNKAQLDMYVKSMQFDVILINTDIIPIDSIDKNIRDVTKYIILLTRNVFVLNMYIDDIIALPCTKELIYAKLMILKRRLPIELSASICSLIQFNLTHLYMQIDNTNIWQSAYKYIKRVDLLLKCVQSQNLEEIIEFVNQHDIYAVHTSMYIPIFLSIICSEIEQVHIINITADMITLSPIVIDKYIDIFKCIYTINIEHNYLVRK